MNPQYLFIVEGRSSNMLNPFNVIRGKVLDLNTGTWGDGDGYETPYLPVEQWLGYQVLTEDGSEPANCVAACYNANKELITARSINVGQYYAFYNLYSGTRYVKIGLPYDLDIKDYYFGTAETFDSWSRNIFNPLWQDLSLQISKESGQEFFRRKLNGSLTFVSDDFNFILSKSLDFKFVLQIRISYDNRKSWEEYWNGYFYWTDCEFNEDDGYVRVTPSVEDEYSDILAGLENEYNMIDLAPAYEQINIKKRPVIQIIPFKSDGSYSKAGCFKVDGTYWERDCNQVTWSGPIVPLMSQRYYFNIASGIIEMTITPLGQIPYGFPTYIKDMFVGHLYGTSHGYREYSLRHSFVLQSGQWRIEMTFENPEITITNVSTNTLTWKGNWTSGTMTLTSQVSSYGNLLVEVDNPYILFSRLVFDKTDVTGATDIPAEDIMAENENYRFCLQEFNVNSYLYFTDTYSTTPAYI